jgi:PAS domain S-box-containing protein
MDTNNLINVHNPEFYDQILKENAYYKSIIENNSFYIIKTDLQGNYTYLNPFFCQIFNLDADELIGKESFSLIIPEDRQACLNTIKKCYSEPGKSFWVILRMPSLSGILCTQWEFKLLMSEDNSPSEIVRIGHDITLLMSKQEELQKLVEVTSDQNNRLLNFTYIISHNIRSHVSNIIGIVNINETDSPEDRETTWNLIKQSANSLDETIHNLSEIISIQSSTNLPVTHVRVKTEMEKIIDHIQIMVNEVDTKINFIMDEEFSLHTNPAYFESIILNLFTNAIKYKSPDRNLEINITAGEDGKYKILSFNDNGLGIDLSKYEKHLFGMYKTFHGNKDAKGLGLFIVKTQIEAMKGKIEVESEVNKGTTFRLFFS